MSLLDDLMTDVGYPALQAAVGETVVYRPGAGGQPRTIENALVLRDGDIATGNAGIEDREFTRVTVPRTASGINAPSVGDVVVLPEDDKPYAWTGRKEEVSAVLWQLEFSRTKLLRQGTAHTMDR